MYIYCFFFQIIYQSSSFSKWFASLISIPKGPIHCWASKSWGNIWKDLTAYSRTCARWSNGWPEWNKSVYFPYFSVLTCICLFKSLYFRRHYFSEVWSQLQNYYIEISEVFDFAKLYQILSLVVCTLCTTKLWALQIEWVFIHIDILGEKVQILILLLVKLSIMEMHNISCLLILCMLIY